MTNEMQMNNEEGIVLKKPSIFGMIMNPTEQFERIKKNPKFIVALLIVTGLTMVGMFLMAQGMDFIGNDPELMEMGEEALVFITLIAQITFVVAGLFTPIITIVVATAIYFAVAKLTQSTVTFKQLFSMTTYIGIINGISIVINGLSFMVVGTADPDTLFTSINSIIGATGFLGGFLSSIEIFSIWTLIISALGLQIVAKFSKGLSWGIAIAFFIIMALFTTVSAGLSAMVGV